MIQQNSVLLTDLYQLTMLQGYFEQGMNDIAVFEFFIRDLPEGRGFLMAAGLDQVAQYLEDLQFTAEELDYLSATGRFSEAFVDSLAEFRFTGDVDAMREGEIFFANEPILRVTAPINQAQLIESRIINLLHYQTLIASKAARCVLAGPEKLLVDFGMRRAHGAEAALLAARASYLAGFSGTSTVLAEPLYGIPVYGTMAHSFIEAHDTETQAFLDFARSQPGNVVLLIDTYDTEAAAEKVVAMAGQFNELGIEVKAVRLDSGDIAAHARCVRAILDEGGMEHVAIFASGNMDETIIADYARHDVPVDGFGVGTRLDTSADAPYLDCAYKLQEYAGIPRRKISEGKATWAGRKQVYRRYENNGTMLGDVVALLDGPQQGQPLLHPLMRRGRRVENLPTLEESRVFARQRLDSLPAALKQLQPYPYGVEISPSLVALSNELGPPAG